MNLTGFFPRPPYFHASSSTASYGTRLYLKLKREGTLLQSIRYSVSAEVASIAIGYSPKPKP